MVILGSAAGHVTNWSDTQVVATVDPSSVSGVLRVQQNGNWSNTLTFTIPGGNITLVPNVLTLVAGETRTITAINAAGQAVTGLTWTTSDSTIVSLSTDDPPVLSALAVGHVTIKAGSASADVIVSAIPPGGGDLPTGTVLWSNPAPTDRILPAVPAATGAADVFAVTDSGQVSAITSDGTTAWTAGVSWNGAFAATADFQGGLIYGTSSGSLARLDGLTGSQTFQFVPSGTLRLGDRPVPHPDGTVFQLLTDNNDWHNFQVVGLDSATGGQKFSVPIAIPSLGSIFPNEGTAPCGVGPTIVAGDGYAYVPYGWFSDSRYAYNDYHLRMLRISTDGSYSVLTINDWSGEFTEVCSLVTGLITNRDTGTLLTWIPWDDASPSMAVTTGTSVSLATQPAPGVPVLQAQDGSFVGVADPGNGKYMVAFDQSGGVRWTVAGDEPKIATADGGVIGQSGTIYNSGGGATGQAGALPTYSWKGAYQRGSVIATIPAFDISLIATTYAAAPQGNLTGNGFSLVHHTFGIVFCGPEGSGLCPSSDLFNNSPISFSYLPVASLNDQTYNAPPPTGPADFSGAFPGWVQTIQKQANDAYKAAFALMPAIVSQGWKANSTTAPHFEHTIYATSKWWTGGDFGMKGEPAGITAGLGNCDGSAICATSNVYYLTIMGYAQQALQFIPPGSTGPVSPMYPPSNPSATEQFVRVVTAIGTGIGNIAVHETGHQLTVPELDCSTPGHDACSEENVYQNGNSSGTANEWFYGPVPGVKIHWTLGARCKIYKYLGMKNTGCP
jgi:hypothetical protein